MKKWLLAATAAAALAAPAQAADMPVKAPPAVAEVLFNWTGFYIGINGGGGWSRTQFDVVIPAALDIDHRGRAGVVIGGHGGFNWQWNNFVLGVEVDGDHTTMRGRRDCPNPTFSCAHFIDSLFSARGRLGFLVGAQRQILLYGTGGGAWGHAAYEARNSATGSLIGGFRQTTNLHGWVGGGGVEYRLSQNLSARAEYLYYGFSTKRLDCTAQPGVGTQFCDVRPTAQVIRGGITWHFGGGPIIARN